MSSGAPERCEATAPDTGYDVLIVGAGHAGSQAAQALRQAKFGGSIALIGDEPELPYERPPLSKDYLSGRRPFDRLLIRPAAFWADREVSVLPGRRVIAVDPVAHRVRTDDGAGFAYGQLIWAAGGSPRTLSCPGHDLAGVHTIRTRADTDRIRADLGTTRRVVVIGGGYIGLEAAAVLVGAAKQVTVVETQDRVLARVAGEPLSRFYEKEHQSRGVDLRLGATVECVEGQDGQVQGVRLAGGELLRCEMVIVGIGIDPAVGPLLAAGARGGNGAEVDAWCRTSLPDVFAVGDCALHRNRYAGYSLVRLESVQNAHDQAAVVAKVLTGTAAMYDVVPWFWSNQYDLRLQTAGLSAGHDDLVVRGDPASRRFSVVYLKGGRVTAIDCVNSTKDFVQGKRLVAEAVRVAPGVLGDSRIALKEM